MQTSQLKYSVMLGFMSRINDRFSSYGVVRDVADKIALAAQVEGAQGVEIVYPAELRDLGLARRALDQGHLAVSSVNVNLKAEEKFHLGSLTHRDPGIRREAVDYLKTGLDIAGSWDVNLVTVCPLADGFDYPFQADYTRAWRWFLDGVGEAAAYRPDVRLSLEYKMHETRTHAILPNVGMALAACELVGLPNVGVTMDMGHAYMAHESPAQSVTILAQSGRLFLVHVNDNYREWDWDLIPGALNPWDLVELVLYLRRVGYNGWFVSDVAPFRLDPVKVASATYRGLVWGERVLDAVGAERLVEILTHGDPIDAQDLIQQTLLPELSAAKF